MPIFSVSEYVESLPVREAIDFVSRSLDNSNMTLSGILKRSKDLSGANSDTYTIIAAGILYTRGQLAPITSENPELNQVTTETPVTV